jgi:ribosomal-protein-serine acetyltransferase
MSEIPRELTDLKLMLRRLVTTDAPELNALVVANLEHLRPWMPWVNASESMTLDQRRSLIEGWKADGEEPYAIYHDGEMIGVCGTHRRIGHGGIEIGYWLSEAHVGNGYMTKAVALATSAVFEDDRIDRIEIHHDKANTRSRAVPSRLSYTLMSESHGAAEAPGEVGVDCVWVMTRDSHDQLRSQK